MRTGERDASGMTAAVHAASASLPPIGVLVVPHRFADRLDAAQATGAADAAAFGEEHPDAVDRVLITNWAVMQADFPPNSDAADLAELHALAKTRTAKGIAAARFWADHGLDSIWEAKLEEYARHVGPAQAVAARKLLHDALMMTNTATSSAKSSMLRKRPFVVDPTLKLAVPRPGNNPSYPSGHTSSAYAACIVLAHLMPDRAEEFLQIAREASFSRIYGGVHFPTDVLAGARIGSTVATFLATRSDTVPVLGTNGTNPGVAGTRRALPGAVRLAGRPLLEVVPQAV